MQRLVAANRVLAERKEFRDMMNLKSSELYVQRCVWKREGVEFPFTLNLLKGSPLSRKGGVFILFSVRLFTVRATPALLRLLCLRMNTRTPPPRPTQSTASPRACGSTASSARGALGREGASAAAAAIPERGLQPWPARGTRLLPGPRVLLRSAEQQMLVLLVELASSE
jgi:hypothetical protein